MIDHEKSALREAVDTLAANLRVVSDLLEGLLEDGKFPARGRTADDRESHDQWWEDRFEAVRRAREALKQAKNTEN